jgi:hypothetical protein
MHDGLPPRLPNAGGGFSPPTSGERAEATPYVSAVFSAGTIRVTIDSVLLRFVC